MNHESLYQSLFDQLRNDPTLAAEVKTFSRKLLHWSDVEPSQQPAIFQAQGEEVPSYASGNLPPKWQLHPKIYLYVHTTGDSTKIPTTIMNPLIDDIIAALAPNSVTNTLMLGGNAVHARVENITTDEGVLGDQAVAIIQFDILAI